MSGNLPVYNIIHYLPINGWPADPRNDWYSARFTKRVHFFSQVLISDRATAFSLRFIYNCRSTVAERRIGPLSFEELEQARKFWIRRAQAGCFPLEITALKRNQRVSSKSKLVCLSPFLDKDGTVRVGGRIERADIPFSGRHPVVLSPFKRMRPRVHQAGLLHAISPISVKLGQFKGSTPKLQKTNWFLFWIFLGGDRRPPPPPWFCYIFTKGSAIISGKSRKFSLQLYLTYGHESLYTYCYIFSECKEQA